MKFFMEVDHAPTDPKYPRHVYPTNLYGPFETDEQVRQGMLLVRGSKLDQEYLVFSGEIIKVSASPLDRSLDQRREPGDFKNFEVQGNWYICRDCKVQAEHGSIQDNSLGEGGQVTWFPVCQHCDLTAGQMGDRPISLRNIPCPA